MKTIKLDTQIVIPNWTPARRGRWYDIPVPISATICMCSLLLIAILVGKIQSAPAATAVPTPGLIIVYATSAPAIVAPTSPPQPTPEPQVVYVEVPAPQPEPQVVYVQQPVYVEAPINAAPTPTEQVYQADSEPNALAARQALIGTDPNALACQNAQGVASPLCGGVTNAQAQAALDKERQQDQPAIVPAFPTRDPASKVDPVTYSSVQQEWRDEHCTLVNDPTTCH